MNTPDNIQIIIPYKNDTSIVAPTTWGKHIWYAEYEKDLIEINKRVDDDLKNHPEAFEPVTP